MPSTCEFNFENEDQVYYTGEVILGDVILVTSNRKEVSYVAIIFNGSCKVINTEAADTNSSVVPAECFAEENYVNEITTVIGEASLPAGTYSWPFRFLIPDNCCTSLEGPNGRIRYQITLKVKNKNKYSNYFVKALTVIKRYDLNMDPIHKLAQSCEMNAVCSFGTFRFKLLCTLNTPVGAYAPGQLLKYVITLNERSSDNIERYIVYFVKIMKFRAVTPRRYERESKTILYEVEFMDNGENNQIYTGEFIIPSIPPTIRVKYISVEYDLVLKATLSISATNFKVKVPIVVGTVPLLETLLPDQKPLVVTLSAAEGEIEPKSVITAACMERAANTDAPFVDKLAVDRVDNFLPSYPSYRS